VGRPEPIDLRLRRLPCVFVLPFSPPPILSKDAETPCSLQGRDEQRRTFLSFFFPSFSSPLLTAKRELVLVLRPKLTDGLPLLSS